MATYVVRTWQKVPTKDDDQHAAVCKHLGFCLSCFAILAYQVISVQPHYCKGKPRVGLRTHGLCVQRLKNRGLVDRVTGTRPGHAQVRIRTGW